MSTQNFTINSDSKIPNLISFSLMFENPNYNEMRTSNHELHLALLLTDVTVSPNLIYLSRKSFSFYKLCSVLFYEPHIDGIFPLINFISNAIMGHRVTLCILLFGLLHDTVPFLELFGLLT